MSKLQDYGTKRSSMKINCPRCDKTLEPEEIQNGECACKLRFRIGPKTDLAVFQENVLLDRLAEEIVSGKESKPDYYEQTIELTKGHFPSTVHMRREASKQHHHCTFYLVRDSEIICFLFRVVKKAWSICVEFDSKITGLNKVRAYKRGSIHDQKYRKIRSVLNTKDFQYAMELMTWVYEQKSKAYGTGRLKPKLGHGQMAGIKGSSVF